MNELKQKRILKSGWKKRKTKVGKIGHIDKVKYRFWIT